MARTVHALLLLVPLCLGAAPPQDPGAAPSPADPAVEQAAKSLAIGQIEQRMTVPVQVNAGGPFRFVVDTGAERSVVSRDIASRLGLEQGPNVTLTSMTETSVVPTVIVTSLAIPAIGERRLVATPALDSVNIGASGLLGLDALENRRVVVDFEHQTMSVAPALAHPQRHATDEIVVRAKSKFGQLIVTDAFLDDRRLRVVIDTGSQVSIGNSALLRLVQRHRQNVRPATITSVTGGTITLGYGTVQDIELGGVRFARLPIAFADVPPFARFGLSDTPGLLLGMDALRSFRRVDIDFANRQIRLLMPRDPDARFATAGTGSLIRGTRISRTDTIYLQ